MMEPMDENIVLSNFKQWNKLNELNADDVYIGGTCALLYSLDSEEFLKENDFGDYVSLLLIVNTSGSDKKELAAFGKETIANVASLPLKYYYCKEPQVPIHIITSYLTNWNQNLKSAHRSIKLVISIPEKFIKNLIFSNIAVTHISQIDCGFKTLENIVKCFKFHYRKLQIINNIVCGADSNHMEILDYINMISAAWHNVSTSYIYNLFYKSENPNMDITEENLSLSNWCSNYNVALKISWSNRSLDDLIFCDNELPNIMYDELQDKETVHETEFNKGTPTSEIEAYQAMKRLVSYLQNEQVDANTVKSTKLMEDHLEHEAFSAIQKIITCKNSNISVE